MIIDLTHNGVLNPTLSRIMTEISDEIRDSYTRYVEKLAEANRLQGLEWLVGVTCRNVGSTDVFVIFSRMQLLLYVLEIGLTVTEILVDSRSTKDLVEQIIKKHGIRPNVRYRRKDRYCSIVVLRNVLISTYLAVIKQLAKKLSGSVSLPVDDIVYVETIIYKNSFNSEGKFLEPYYPGIEDYLPKTIKECLWYVPCDFYRCKSIQGYLRLMRSCKESKKKFLIKEQWLTARDYIWAIAKALTLGKSVSIIPMWNEYDISKMIEYEINRQAASGWLVEPLLLYRFVGRLKERDVGVKFVLDWNENQQIDRALSLAMREHYPGIPISGYQGFVVSQRFVGHDLANYEVKAGTTPDKIFVVSERLVSERKRYCGDLEVRSAPAFRFQSAIDFIKTDSHRDIILVGCPIQPFAVTWILRLCLASIVPEGYQFVVKRHPSTTEKEFLDQVPEARDKRFQIDERNLHDILPKTSLLISFDSTICIEAAVCGIPVAVVVDPTRGGNPLAGRINKRYWSEVYSSEDLTAAIKGIEGTDCQKLSNFFVPVTKETVLRMFQ